MKTMCPPGYHHNHNDGFVATHALQTNSECT